MTSAYWWSPRRDGRAFLSEMRHNGVAWSRMIRSGGSLLRNFGDELSALVLREATGRQLNWASVKRADVIGIGSILDLYVTRGGRGLIWGSGLRSPEIGRPDLDGRVLAVRGQLTRDALALDRATTLGDPGLLARAIFSTGTRKGELVLPHFSAFQSSEGLRLIRHLRGEGLKILAPSAPVQEVCREIARAQHVLTSSLHGLVVADALRTPVTLVSFGDTREPGFKYDDYASALASSVQFVGAEAVVDFGNRQALLGPAETRATAVDSVVDGLVEGLYGAARAI